MSINDKLDNIIVLSSIKDGIGKRKVKSFLDTLFSQMVEQCTKYMDTINEAPYRYKEKQLHSIIAPSIAKLTPAFLMEQPISRQWSKNKKQNYNDSHGWLDYWCRYGEYDYFIELKHNFDAFSTDNIRERTIRNWVEMNEQLDVVRKEAKRYSSSCKGVFLISLHVITVYETVLQNHKPESIENYERLSYIQKNYFENLNKCKSKPNWSGLWIIPEGYVNDTKQELDSGSIEYYPSLFIVANVSELIK